jgi:hypothetical protein
LPELVQLECGLFVLSAADEHGQELLRDGHLRDDDQLPDDSRFGPRRELNDGNIKI